MAIVGDILHSRVARSDIHALTTLGVPEVRVDRPEDAGAGRPRSRWACASATTCDEGMRGCDVDHHAAPAERAHERRAAAVGAASTSRRYGLTPEKLALAKPDAIVMHPGPINRGVEIDSAVADGAQSVILPQVTFGIAVRMAVMSIVAGNS